MVEAKRLENLLGMLIFSEDAAQDAGGCGSADYINYIVLFFSGTVIGNLI